MPELIVAPEAELDLDEIHATIAVDNPDAANRVLEAAHKSFLELARMPGLGRPRTFAHTALGNLRSWRVGRFRNYLIFYRPLPDARGVEIVRVVHGARELDALFGD